MPVHSLGEGRGKEIRGQHVGGLCYIFFAGNCVMIDFKCYFIAIFFLFEDHHENLDSISDKRRKTDRVCNNFNCFLL